MSRQGVLALIVFILASLSVAPVGGASAARVRRPAIAIACRSLFKELNTPPRVGGPASALVLAHFAVLRRTQQPQDAPPAGPDLLDAITGPFTRYDPHSVRRLGAVPDSPVFVVSGTAAPPRISLQCRRALPAAQRRAVLDHFGVLPPGPGYCLLEYVPAVLVPEMCGSYAGVAGGYALGSDSQGRATHYLGLVPDGVGDVRLTYARPQAPVTLTVADNLASGPAPIGFTSVPMTRSPGRLRRYLERTLPTSVTWLAASGWPVVRRFPRPPRLVEQLLHEIERFASVA